MRVAKFKQLSFNSSGSAKAKFMGTPIEVESHWRLETDAERLMCPNRLTDGEFHCSGCSSNLVPRMRIILPAWDIKKSKWAVMMMDKESLAILISEMRMAGIDPDLIRTGAGPEFLVQRIKTHKIDFSFLPMVETIGINIPQPPPDTKVLLRELARQSIWVHHSV